MHPHDGDPQAKADAGVDVAADRRRADRPKVISPQLLPLLRGHFDRAAPTDPERGKPDQLWITRALVHRSLVSGAIIVAALFLVGAMLRFVI